MAPPVEATPSSGPAAGGFLHVNLDDALLARQGPHCLIPDCGEPWTEKAHIWPSGMGGQPSTYRAENLVGMCRHHHDVFDGRDMAGRQRMLRQLMEILRDHNAAARASA